MNGGPPAPSAAIGSVLGARSPTENRRNRHEEGTRTKVATTTETAESPLPPKVQEALGEMVGAAREGLLALSVGVGLSVVHELMESEVTEVVGPKGKHDPEGRQSAMAMRMGR